MEVSLREWLGDCAGPGSGEDWFTQTDLKINNLLDRVSKLEQAVKNLSNPQAVFTTTVKGSIEYASSKLPAITNNSDEANSRDGIAFYKTVAACTISRVVFSQSGNCSSPIGTAPYIRIMVGNSIWDWHYDSIRYLPPSIQIKEAWKGYAQDFRPNIRVPFGQIISIVPYRYRANLGESASGCGFFVGGDFDMLLSY